MRVVRRRTRRLIGYEQLEYEPSARLRPLGSGHDLHGGVGPANAGGREHALAIDLDHAGAAIAIRPIARRRQVAQMRDLDPMPVSHLPDCLARQCLDLVAVEEELDRLGHLRLYLTMSEPGFAKPWRDRAVPANHAFGAKSSGK
jgi:hypothetical protein